MVNVTMSKFAEFCVGDSSERHKIISKRESDRLRQQSRRQMDLQSGGPGYYAGLLKVLRVNHWETDDIGQLDEAVFDLDPNKRGNRKKLQTYYSLKGKYVAKWRTEEARYFKVPRCQLPFENLRVAVDPEVGMRTSTADRTFKLWFFEWQLTAEVIEVCSYLLWEAAEYAEWPRTSMPGIWAVRDSKLVDAQRPLDATEDLVRQRATEFVTLTSQAKP